MDPRPYVPGRPREQDTGGRGAAELVPVRPVADQDEPCVPGPGPVPGPQQDVLALLPAQPPHAHDQGRVGRNAVQQSQAGAGRGRPAAGPEAAEVDAVVDHRPAGGDPRPLARPPFGLADAEDAVAPAGPEALPRHGHSGGPALQGLERPGVRLEHGRHQAPYGESAHESRLGTVGMDHIGGAGTDQPGRGGDLTSQPRPRNTLRGPGAHTCPGIGRLRRQRPVGRAGDHGAQSRPDLCGDEVRHDPCDAALHRLDQMKDRQSIFLGATLLQHARLFSHMPI